MALSVASERYA